MNRLFSATFALSLTAAPLALAANPPAQTAAIPQEDFQAEAEKTCSTLLDRDQFSYNSMEECVADKTVKLQHQAAQHASAADPKATRPN